MKKSAVLFAVIMALAVPAAFAQNATTFNLASTTGYDVYYNYGTEGIWVHHMTVDKMDMATGNFAGTGYYIPNKMYTWNIVTGNVTGSLMKYKVTYTGLSAGYYIEHDGSIAAVGDFKGNCNSSYQKCTYYTKVTTIGDGDGDKVTDDKDKCPSTKAGEKVNAVGCSMLDLCPCVYWTNHGEYVSCIAHAKAEFVAAGILTDAEATAIQSEAARSDCGKKK